MDGRPAYTCTCIYDCGTCVFTYYETVSIEYTCIFFIRCENCESCVVKLSLLCLVSLLPGDSLPAIRSLSATVYTCTMYTCVHVYTWSTVYIVG